MKTIMKFCTLFILLALAILSMASTGNIVTPEKSQVTDFMQNYNLDNQNNSLQLACEIGQYVSTQYGWNCDIRQLNFTSHAPVYINVFYPAADNKKGYEAYYGWFGPQRKEVKDFYKKDEISNNNVMYYRDWGSEKNNWCGIQGVKSYGIIRSYWGNVTEDTDPVVIPEDNNTTVPEDPKPNHTEDVEVCDNTFVNSGNQTRNNITVVKASGNQTIGNDSKNSVNNQGKIDKLIQHCLDFSNAHLSNVTFNFFGQ